MTTPPSPKAPEQADSSAAPVAGVLAAIVAGFCILGFVIAVSNQAGSKPAASADKDPAAKVAKEPAYIPPADHLQPFNVEFKFGNQSEVDHFWKWNHQWTFSDEFARNQTWENDTFIESRYQLVGDFELHIQGMMSKSYSNSRRPHLIVCGKSIQLTSRWMKFDLDVTVKRDGLNLTVTQKGSDPETMLLSETERGPTTVRLHFHNRHATIRRFAIKAAAGDRVAD